MFVDQPFCVISGFRRCVPQIFDVPGWYTATLLASYRLFETTYPSYIEGSRSAKRIMNEMFALVGCYAA